MIPISALEYPSPSTFGNEVVAAFQSVGIWMPDAWSSTGRVILNRKSHCGPSIRRVTIARIKEMLPEDEAQRLIDWLEVSDWNLSFLVDNN
jgi:hypothetical protein